MLSFGLTVLLDGVSFGMILFLISVGLTVTMGLMRVVNLAHGAFAMIGGYVAGYLTQRGCNFYLAALAAAAAAAAIGAATERTIYQPLYRKGELAQVLLTVGFVFVATGAVSEVFGAFPYPVGCGLAGLGGALGSGILSLEPAYALKYVVLFLVVMIVGGEGSFEGSFV